MALDMEELNFIPAASHSSARWRFWLEEANRTTSSAKSTGAVLRFPSQTPSSPRLRLELHENYKRDRWQGAALATRTVNKSDFVPRMQTQLFLWLYMRIYRQSSKLQPAWNCGGCLKDKEPSETFWAAVQTWRWNTMFSKKRSCVVCRYKSFIQG